MQTKRLSKVNFPEVLIAGFLLFIVSYFGYIGWENKTKIEKGEITIFTLTEGLYAKKPITIDNKEKVATIGYISNSVKISKGKDGIIYSYAERYSVEDGYLPSKYKRASSEEIAIYRKYFPEENPKEK